MPALSSDFAIEEPSAARGAVTVGGVPTTRLSRRELAELVAASVRHDTGPAKVLFDINGQGLAMSIWDEQYRANLLAADLIHADGQPMVIASRCLTSSPISERSATTDLIHDVAQTASETGSSFYLLGGTEDVNTYCSQRLRQTHERLRIAGRRHGYFDATDESAVCADINDSGADIVWVGLGKPREQDFCIRNRGRLRARWLITCGGCFNFVAGDYRRAPNWMQRAGFEWLHRMASRPRQLALRYLTTTPIALYLLLTRTRDAG